jgi:hypothetical protein
LIEDAQTKVLQKRHEFVEAALARAIYLDLEKCDAAGSAQINRVAVASRHGFELKDVAHGEKWRKE